MGRSSAQSECVKPKEGMRSLRAGFQTEGCEINLVGQEQHFKKKKKNERTEWKITESMAQSKMERKNCFVELRFGCVCVHT